MVETLRPCPFCGGKPVEHYPGGTAYGIECEDCNIGTSYVCLPDYQQSVDAWNRRVDECDRDALLALAEEMGHPIKQAVWNQTAGVRREHIMAEYARRIREACGEQS